MGQKRKPLLLEKPGYPAKKSGETSAEGVGGGGGGGRRSRRRRRRRKEENNLFSLMTEEGKAKP